MSHLVTIQTKVHDAAAVSAACRRLGLVEPVHGTAKLYSGEATGLIVQLPGWQYPAVVDTVSGTLRYDNFEGAWGAQAEIDRFIQMYTVENCRLEARKRGHQITEQTLQDGSIKLQVMES